MDKKSVLFFIKSAGHAFVGKTGVVEVAQHTIRRCCIHCLFMVGLLPFVPLRSVTILALGRPHEKGPVILITFVRRFKVTIFNKSQWEGENNDH